MEKGRSHEFGGMTVMGPAKAPKPQAVAEKKARKSRKPKRGQGSQLSLLDA